MATREFQGAGGLRLHLDEPFSPQMEDQIRKGHLVPVTDEHGDGEGEPDSSAQGGDPKAESDGDGPKRPSANSKVDDWRTYAISLGMDEADAAAATKAELQDWVKVAETDSGSGD